MRQQYHFRKIDGHLYIWDVNKIIKSLEGKKPRKVAIAAIKELDEAYWFEKGALVTGRDFLHHMRLVNEASLSYPIILCSEGRLIDGMHRVIKAALLNQESIYAVQLDSPLAPDYVDVDPDTLPYDDD